MSNVGTTDAVRELMNKNPNISNDELYAALPQFSQSTVRTIASRFRGADSEPTNTKDVEKALIADHLAGKITAQQLSEALHMRGRIEAQRKIFVDVMIRANVIASALAIATTEEALVSALTEKNAIIIALGGTPATINEMVAASIPPVPPAPSIAA